ncbi:MAG: hypothetical protein AUJ82_05560 [Verrucomicrobia bacterium CG1_02_43_26]|nr:MAG: hypothetical protein AUJ82_05560 [Verrucomicrobia bacterium CG1_02_43_26]
MFESYRAQVELLLRIIPFVAEEECFALKGGTAINLFVRDFPRLSVDIDLTYTLFDDRKATLHNIGLALKSIKKKLERVFKDMTIQSKPCSEDSEVKLICTQDEAQVKIEVSPVMRGALLDTRLLTCAPKVAEEFEAFVEMKVISNGELYGGKICAALDRQHPRDLFDIYYLFENEGMGEDIKQGFIAGLLSHGRPINELLTPNMTDQKAVYNNKFEGMANAKFSYEMYEETRRRLVREIKQTLTVNDKRFLLSFKEGRPEWSLINIARLKELPAVKWKLQNIRKLMKMNSVKHQQQYSALQEKLEL